jgi:hypothetical protein
MPGAWPRVVAALSVRTRTAGVLAARERMGLLDCTGGRRNETFQR